GEIGGPVQLRRHHDRAEFGVAITDPAQQSEPFAPPLVDIPDHAEREIACPAGGVEVDADHAEERPTLVLDCDLHHRMVSPGGQHPSSPTPPATRMQYVITEHVLLPVVPGRE